MNQRTGVASVLALIGLGLLGLIAVSGCWVATVLLGLGGLAFIALGLAVMWPDYEAVEPNTSHRMRQAVLSRLFGREVSIPFGTDEITGDEVWICPYCQNIAKAKRCQRCGARWFKWFNRARPPRRGRS
jgi:hypothetical protein